MIAEALPPLPAPPPPAASGPYKFLDYFHDTEVDRRRFGGREREVREIVARLVSERTLVIYGPSGSGKTSLLLAGVFPALRKEGYRPIYARTLVEPLTDLCRALAAVSGRTETGAGWDLRALASELLEAGPTVVVLDQFEEFFTRFRDKPDQRAAFIEAVAGLINDPAFDRFKIAFSLREDYLAALDEFGHKLREPLSDRRYRIEPLTAFGVRQAVAKPLVDAHIAYEPAVISKLVSQLESVGFEPPLLQILCTELYQEALRRANGSSPCITLKDLDQLGGPEGIFRRYVNSVGNALPPERHLLARMVLDALITREGTKRAATLADLLASRFSASEEEVREILDLFVSQRLLRRQGHDSEVWYEVTHERLVPSIQEWLEADSEFIKFRQARNFVRGNSESDLWRRNPETLLNEGVFKTLLGPYQERFLFNERELEFILCSAVYQEVPDIAFWARRLGAARAVDLLEKLADSPQEEVRRVAVLAAGSLEEVEGRLARICLRLAMEDPNEAVRRTAGRSLARHARNEERHTLSLALADLATHKRARAVLASMALGGDSLQDFPWTVRRLSRLRGRRSAYRENRDVIRSRRTAGAFCGALGATAWMVSLIPLIVLDPELWEPSTQQGASKEPDLGLVEMGVSVLLGLVLMLVLGAFLGRLASGVAAKSAAVRGEGRWFSALVRSPGLWSVSVLLGGLISFSYLDGKTFPIRLSAALVTAGLCHLSLAFVVQLSRSCLGLASRAETWLWGLVVSFGIPLWVVVVGDTQWSPDLPDGIIWAGLWVSFAACVSIIAIARSAAMYPLGDPNPILPARIRRYRILAALAAVLMLVMSMVDPLMTLFGSQEVKPASSAPTPRDRPVALPSGRNSEPPR